MEHVQLLVLREQAADAEREAAELKEAGLAASVFVVDPPFPESIIAALALGPLPDEIDVTRGPPILTHATQYVAQLLEIPHHVLSPFGFRLSLPALPCRRPPVAWAGILRALAGRDPPQTVAELATRVGLSESTLRYHLFGRGVYRGLVDSQYVAADRGQVRLLPLGRAVITSGVFDRVFPEAAAPNG